MPVGEVPCEGRGCSRMVLALENPYCDACWRIRVETAAVSQQAGAERTPEVRDPLARHRRKV